MATSSRGSGSISPPNSNRHPVDHGRAMFQAGLDRIGAGLVALRGQMLQSSAHDAFQEGAPRSSVSATNYNKDRGGNP